MNGSTGSIKWRWVARWHRPAVVMAALLAIAAASGTPAGAALDVPHLLTGDFNGDGMTDLALTGVPGWDAIPVAFSTGGGQFNSTALSTPLFPELAATAGVKVVTGDFNGDGKTDLALTGVPEWDSIPVAFSTGGGQFNSTALSTPLFPELAATARAAEIAAGLP
jgi:hypothetical protein